MSTVVVPVKLIVHIETRLPLQVTETLSYRLGFEIASAFARSNSGKQLVLEVSPGQPESLEVKRIEIPKEKEPVKKTLAKKVELPKEKPVLPPPPPLPPPPEKISVPKDPTPIKAPPPVEVPVLAEKLEDDLAKTWREKNKIKSKVFTPKVQKEIEDAIASEVASIPLRKWKKES